MRIVTRLFALSSLVLAFQASALAGNQIQGPRPVTPAVDATNAKAVNALMSSLVEEYEGLKIGDNAAGEEDDLQIYTDDTLLPCKATSVTVLECELGYLQDRWNGVISATFRTEGSKIVELTSAGFDGNF